MGMVEEDVEAVEVDAVDRGGGGEIQHLVQADGRLAAVALPHQARPDRVVQLRIIVRMVHGGISLRYFLRWSPICGMFSWTLGPK